MLKLNDIYDQVYENYDKLHNNKYFEIVKTFNYTKKLLKTMTEKHAISLSFSIMLFIYFMN